MIWIEKLYNNKSIIAKLKLTFLLFILPIFVIFIPFVITRWHYIYKFGTIRILSLIAAGSWSFIGPLCIQCFFKKVREFDELVDRVKDIKEKHKDYLEKYLPIYKKLTIISTTIWGTIIVSNLIFFNKYLNEYAFFGLNDIYFWILILYCVFLAYLQSFGFAGLPLVLLIQNECFKSDSLLKMILVDDFNGGVKKVGSLTVITCLCFATGALYFPILVVFAKNGDNFMKCAIYSLIIIFALALLIFFTISYFVIKKFANKAKNEIVDEVRDIYREKLIDSIKNVDPDSLLAIRKELHISNLHNRVNDLEKINTKPVDIHEICVTLITIFIPVILYIKDIIDFINSMI